MYRLLTAVATLVAEHKLLSTGSVLALLRLVVPRHMVSLQTRDQTCVQRIGRWMFYHWTIREVPLRKSHDLSTRILMYLSFNWGVMYVNTLPYKIWCPQPITDDLKTRRQFSKLIWTC